MRVLIIHNRYQRPGGEDAVVTAESVMLESAGDTVSLLVVDNDGIVGLVKKIQTAARSLYSFESKQLVLDRIRQFRPEVVHVHNFFPQLSPSIYDACREQGVPVVQTLHNFRLVCPSAYLFRDGKVCELCPTAKSAASAIRHRCYRNSTAGTTAVAAMLGIHRLRDTWNTKVAAYIALTNFARDKFISWGFPPDKIHVKPNFISRDRGIGEGNGDFFLFVGRLSPEKGIETLLSAWKGLPSTLQLKIVGDGPLRDSVCLAANNSPNIEWLGWKNSTEVASLMKVATAVLVPSEWYEMLPLVIIEAFNVGTPVIASHLGGLPDLIEDGRTGYLVPGGDSAKLAHSVLRLRSANLQQFRHNARAAYESNFTAAANYPKLQAIYTTARKLTSP